MPAGPVAPGPAQDRASFINSLASNTMLDPRVLNVWVGGEGHPGDYPGYWNYLNIQTPTATSLGITPKGTGPANTAIFGSESVGLTAAKKEIDSLGIKPAQTPRQQLLEIAQSPWASSHYTDAEGRVGGNLLSRFSSLYGPAALDKPVPAGISVNPSGGTTGSATGAGPVGDAAAGVVGAITGPIHSIEDAIKFVFSYRFLEIVGGGLLLLLGLYLLAQQFKQTFPIPLPKTATSPFEQGAATQERAESRSAGKREVRRRVAGTSATQEANEAGARAERATANS